MSAVFIDIKYYPFISKMEIFPYIFLFVIYYILKNENEVTKRVYIKVFLNSENTFNFFPGR